MIIKVGYHFLEVEKIVSNPPQTYFLQYISGRNLAAEKDYILFGKIIPKWCTINKRIVNYSDKNFAIIYNTNQWVSPTSEYSDYPHFIYILHSHLNKLIGDQNEQ